MDFWGWVGAIAAGWFTASILLAGGWAVLRHTVKRAPGVAAAELAADMAEFKVQQDAARGIAQAEQYLRVRA